MVRRRQWQPTPVLLPGKSHGRRSLEGCSPWGHWGSDMTKWLPFHFSLSCIGEGNGNPLQCSCLENPWDEGAWWAAVYGVAQSQTRLKRLSSSMIILFKCFCNCLTVFHSSCTILDFHQWCTSVQFFYILTNAYYFLFFFVCVCGNHTSGCELVSHIVILICIKLFLTHRITVYFLPSGSIHFDIYIFAIHCLSSYS